MRGIGEKQQYKVTQTRETGKAESFEYLYRDGDVARRRFWIVCWDEVTSMMLAWLLRKSTVGRVTWDKGSGLMPGHLTGRSRSGRTMEAS